MQNKIAEICIYHIEKIDYFKYENETITSKIMMIVAMH